MTCIANEAGEQEQGDGEIEDIYEQSWQYEPRPLKPGVRKRIAGLTKIVKSERPNKHVPQRRVPRLLDMFALTMLVVGGICIRMGHT